MGSEIISCLDGFKWGFNQQWWELARHKEMIMAHHLILQAEPFNLEMGQTALTALAWFGWGWDVFGSTCFQVWSSTGEGGFDRWVDRASRNGQIIPKNPGRFIAPKGFWSLLMGALMCFVLRCRYVFFKLEPPTARQLPQLARSGWCMLIDFLIANH